MKKETAKSWCADATRLIKFPPDRETVQEELEQHLIDKQEDLRQQGVPEEQIEALAIAAMGSAEEIAPQLAAIHRPFWGYAYQVCTALLILLMIITIPFFYTRMGYRFGFDLPEFPSFGTAEHIHYDAEPDTKVKSGAYTFTLEQVRISGDVLADVQDEILFLSARIRLQHPQMHNGAELMEFVWAEDNLGNVYHSSSATSHIPAAKSTQFIRVEYYPYWFSNYYILTFYGYCSQDADWIDLHYDRDENSFTLRIELSGGDAQ
jgi:hypothetical protein